VNFGERGKSSGRHSLTSNLKRGLTMSLTKGWPRVCVDLVKGPNRVHWRGFRGDVPGWSRFDRCSTGLTRLIRSLALMTLIKNLGRHTRLPILPHGGSSDLPAAPHVGGGCSPPNPSPRRRRRPRGCGPQQRPAGRRRQLRRRRGGRVTNGTRFFFG
jgi:hypothetical protein